MRKKLPKILFPAPSDCEAAFYDAFERADLNAMMAVWADEPSIVCIHPQGPRLAGLSSISDSFAEIFSHGPGTQLQVSELRMQQSQTLAIHNVYETYMLKGQHLGQHGAQPESQPGTEPRARPTEMPPVLATNIYLLTPNGWRMILHHASLSPRGTTAEEQGVSRILH